MIWHMVHVHLSYYEAEYDLKSKIYILMILIQTRKNKIQFKSLQTFFDI